MHHNHNFWWRFFPHKQLTQIYISAAIRAFAISLISLFVPLYLHKEIGMSLEQTLYFFIFYALIFAITTPLAAKFCSKYGVKHSILISVPLYLLFILLLYFLPIYPIPTMVISALLGMSLAFYWMGLHLIFKTVSNHKHRGEAVGKRISTTIFAHMLGPLLGGFLISNYGFKLVFILVSVLMFLSTYFLFLSKEKHIPFHFSVKGLVDKKHLENSLFFVARGVRVAASGIIWPLFIFVILGNYISLGIVGSVLSGVSAILIWFVGKYSDKIDKRKIIYWLTFPESLSWFLRSAVTTKFHVFAVTIFGALTYGAEEAPLGALEYDKAKENIAEYFVSREIFISLGRLLLIMVVLMTDSLAGGLIFNGVANLAALLF